MGDRKAIFITGGGSGIGRAVALHFAERGWFVGLGDIDKSGLHETAELIGNGFVYSHVFDVRDRAAWDEALEAFCDEFEVDYEATETARLSRTVRKAMRQILQICQMTRDVLFMA